MVIFPDMLSGEDVADTIKIEARLCEELVRRTKNGGGSDAVRDKV
jgi:hypothetical protein